jgi:hypothetical protein
MTRKGENIMLIKDNPIKGETLLQTLAPELQRILQRAPKTGTVEITVFMRRNRLIGTIHKISEQEQVNAPKETGV